MIELNSLYLQGYEAEFYSLSFQRLNFLLLPTSPIQDLRYFSRPTQSSLGKLKVKFNLQWLLAYSHFFASNHYILLTQYQQIVLLPYLFRMYPNIKVIATTLMFELARIFLISLHQKIRDLDVTRQQLTFEEESDVLGNYQEKFDLLLEKWRDLYSLQEIQNTLKKIEKVNYYQIYNTDRGVLITAMPSGKSNGSCLWEVQSIPTQQKILLINDISQHQWRTCQPYNLARLAQKQSQRPYDFVIFTKKSLSRLDEQGQDQKISDYLKKLTNNMNNGITTSIILDDQTLAIDLIPRIAMIPQGKCQSIMLSNSSFHDFSNFCNSYVDFLSEHFKGQIFNQSPQFPLIHYLRLKDKGLVHHGGLQQIAIRKKLPLKQVVLQNQPFIYFVKKYEKILELTELSFISELTKHQEMQLTFQNNFNMNLFTEFINIFKNAKIFGFKSKHVKNNPAQKIEYLNFNNRYILSNDNFEKPIYMNATNMSKNMFQRFNLVNNQIAIKRQQKQFILLPRNYLDLLFNEFINRKISIIQKDKQNLKTIKTHISLSSAFILKVHTSSSDELLIIEHSLSSITQKFNLP